MPDDKKKSLFISTSKLQGNTQMALDLLFLDRTIAKPEISSERADKIGAATGKEGGNTNTFIDQSDNRVDQSQNGGGSILQTVSDSSLVMIMINKNLQNKKTPHFCGV